MKIIINERQVKYLKEDNLSYTPEKLNDFITKSESFYKKSQEAYIKFKNQIIMSSLSDIMSNVENYNQMKELINKFKEKCEEISDNLYNTLDRYTAYENDQVSKLDDLAYKIQSNGYDFNDLLDIISELIDYSNKLNK